MRKFLTLFAVTLITGSLFAGGLVTNTNQSATWVRLPARNASVGIDAAYFNPAGLMKLENGLHFSISNQTITQTKTVQNFYKGPGDNFGLNNSYFDGEVTAPLFPSVYAVYKTDKLAFSLGFMPVGGGGGAVYETGLPSFEMSPSDLVPALASQGATAYRLDAYLKGTSVYYGFQGGISYKINDWISVAAGLRYISGRNSYLGHLKDIQINMGGTWTPANAIMTGIANTATASATNLQNAIDGGFLNAGDPVAPAVAAGLIALGINPAGFTNTIAVAAFGQAAAKYNANATLLGDQEVDVKQTGSAWAPIFSVNLSPSEKLNIGIKYEMITKMELVNKTNKDLLVAFTALGAPITLFKDGEKTASDMPAMLSVGIDYKLTPGVKISLGSEYFFDKSADYGHKLDLDTLSSTPSTHVKNSDIIAQNGWDVEFGLEVNLSDKLLVSGGYIYANKGVNSLYQSDLTFGNASHTFGLGGAYSCCKNLQINLGASYTSYVKDEKLIAHVFSPTGQHINPRETYGKNALIFALGVDFSF